MNLSKFTQGFRQLMLPLGVLAVLGLTIVACSKNENAGPAQQEPTQEEKVAAVKKLIDNMPAFQLVTKDGKSLRVERTEQGGWTFSTPPSESGYNYTSATGTYTFVETSNSGGVLSVAASGFGSNAAGGGVITAGQYSYDMKYTFCLSADDDMIDLGLIDHNFSGVSMVIGVSGDFEKILNGNVNANDEDFEDIFKAFAFYVVYAKRASGSYNIVNWITQQDESDAVLKNKGFAMIFDVKNAQLFFSKSGKLTASGGSIGFTGTYLNVKGIFSDEVDEDTKFKEVSGSGAMGCN